MTLAPNSVSEKQTLTPGYYYAKYDVTRGNAKALTLSQVKANVRRSYGDAVEMVDYKVSTDNKTFEIKLHVTGKSLPAQKKRTGELQTAVLPVIPLIVLASIVTVMVGLVFLSFKFVEAKRIDAADDDPGTQIQKAGTGISLTLLGLGAVSLAAIYILGGDKRGK